MGGGGTWATTLEAWLLGQRVCSLLGVQWGIEPQLHLVTSCQLVAKVGPLRGMP